MENATKALLIAGAVLIVIVLIAVGIRVLSSTSGVTDEVDSATETMGVSVFNSQFTKYTGTQSAAEVKALLSQAAATYRSGNSSSHKVSVVFNEVEKTNANDIMGVMSSINVGVSYDVSVGLDGNGYVNKVTIKTKS